ncbi:hypothetical protein MMC17_009770 [Xylographa soralifera]|nr:hypothetical protein [Xylographa soralifera]
MSWFSILPNSLIVLETWIVRLFILLGVLTIGPWAILIIYDLVLYIVRAATYEIPYIGGRARGRQRPRAPSLAERPSGRPRTFSLSGTIGSGGENEEHEGFKQRKSKLGLSEEAPDAVEDE